MNRLNKALLDAVSGGVCVGWCSKGGYGGGGGDEQLILNNIQAIQVTHVRFSLSA